MKTFLFLLAGLVLLELFARFFLLLRRKEPFRWTYRTPDPKILSFLPHPYCLYVKAKNNEGLYPSNSLGYTGKREFSKQRVPNSLRIYCVGGSTIEGHDPNMGPDATWPGFLQDHLSSRFPSHVVECINAGSSGYTSAESLAEYAFRGVDLKPDILLIYHNVNDAFTAQMLEGFESDYSHARRSKTWRRPASHRIPQIPFLASYQTVRERIVNKFGKANALLYWIADPPWAVTESFSQERVETFRRNIRNMVLLSLGAGCVPVLVKWECDWNAAEYCPPYLIGDRKKNRELYFRYLRANNAVLEELAEEIEGCHYIDVGPFEPRHFSDKIHFSGEGLRIMGLRVAEKLDPIIRSLRPNSRVAPSTAPSIQTR